MSAKLEEGTVFAGRYRVVRCLAASGMGAESLRLDPQPGTLFTLSQCEVKWGRTATAAARLDDYLQLYARRTPDQKAQQLNRLKVVKEQRDKLALEVPELTLKKAIIAENCGLNIDPKNPNDAEACRLAGLDAASRVKPLGLVSTVGFAAELAGVGTAVVLLLTEPRKATPVTGARRPWIAASVLSAGPGGAMVGAQGAW